LLDLSPEEVAVLRKLSEAGNPVSEAGLDPSALRTLQVRRFLRRLGGFSVITPDGRRALQAADAGGSIPGATGRRDLEPLPRSGAPAPETDPVGAGEGEGEPGDAALRINALQEEVLRKLALGRESVPVDDLDGRVLRALEGRGLVRRADGRVEVTSAGRAFYETKVRRRRRARSGWLRVAPQAEADLDERKSRAASIRGAVDALKRAIGGSETLSIGELPAPAEEAFDALLELADRIERGADPRRISR
jgi:hypothetical protein